MSKPLIYVAGPVSGDPWGCVRQALKVFPALRKLGWTPILPQLTILAEIVEHRPYEEYMEWDLDIITRCDAVLRLHGESSGADREVEHAKSLGIPVYGPDLNEHGDTYIPQARPSGDPRGQITPHAIALSQTIAP